MAELRGSCSVNGDHASISTPRSLKRDYQSKLWLIHLQFRDRSKLGSEWAAGFQTMKLVYPNKRPTPNEHS